MPELPEVEVVRAGLEPAVTSARILAAEVEDRRALRRHDASDTFESLVTGRRMLAAVRRGKFLWLPLEPVAGPAAAVALVAGLGPATGPAPAPAAVPASQALLIHLGMSGQVLLREEGAPDDRNVRIRLHIEHPDHGALRVDFVDQRLFGSMAVDTLERTVDGSPGGTGWPAPVLPRQVAHIGRDPLDPSFDERGFVAALALRRSGIKRVLLDQSLTSGIGNIYADEALWAARIHFAQPANTLGRTRALRLIEAVRTVLLRALVSGGTSFDSQYVNVNGASGYFSRSLSVYGRQGQPCQRCGTAIVRLPFMNRSSHLCPRCQRLRVR